MNAPATTETGTKPRIEGEREAEILDGVIDTLIDVGYDRLTFDAVASKVRASKATLYRKWPTKPDLVVGALEHLKAQSMPAGHDPKLPDTGSLVGDLTFHFCEDPQYNDRSIQVFGAVTSAIHRDPELTAVFTDRFVKPRMAELRKAIERAQQRGEVGPDADLDLLASILPAAVTFRVLTTGDCPDKSFVTQVIDNVMLPACRATVS
ncbi:TetR/AcrR family transcriptional regulator [Flexivirga sp. ID2601S]|uniref:TetR/AcrR family transcriptional regulator n=1 Tax=Flexivirga aerilata TaxID=1656889 RepID=A0A849ALM5_9MICO|nr:TetR/AcrR family transcriptional regulator [Flexivirga aerilata]NNG40261.1 TetR/AcrR family transcriptional regulator [Flexivirga aerilata]